MASKNKAHEITIKGIVTPVEWDDDDNVTAVSLEGDDEETYQIEMSAQGERLLEHVDAYVKVTGTARQVGADNILSVRSFVSLDDSTEDGDEDFDAGWSDDGWEEEDEAGQPRRR